MRLLKAFFSVLYEGPVSKGVMDLNSDSEKHTARSPRSQGAKWAACLGLILMAGLFPNASISAQTVPPVETETVREAPVVRRLELSGTVTSPHASHISTSVEGLVSAVHFDSGARVTRGDLLLELDAELEEAAYKQAEARTAHPSGHAATAFAAAVAVGVIYPRLRWPLVCVAGLVALSRVYLGVHYWLDVVVGCALGTAVGLGVAWSAERVVRGFVASPAPT